MKEIKNAKISSTMLGYEDHGILTCMLHLDYGDSCQGFGGYALDEWNELANKRLPHVLCGQYIQSILKVVGVDSWEKLKGQYIRVEADHGKIYRIGSLLKDEWFDPSTL